MKSVNNSGSGLTVEEQNELIPILVGMLKDRKGKAKVFSNSQIRQAFQHNFNKVITEPTIKRMIFHIRKKSLIEMLVANSDAYYVAVSESDAQTWIYLQKGRMEKMQETLDVMTEQFDRNRKTLELGGRYYKQSEIDFFAES